MSRGTKRPIVLATLSFVAVLWFAVSTVAQTKESMTIRGKPQSLRLYG
jgi:hypothetical protein